MQTTLLNTYPPKLTSTILKALSEKIKQKDQLNAFEASASPIPEIPLSTEDTCQKIHLVLAARREDIDSNA